MENHLSRLDSIIAQLVTFRHELASGREIHQQTFEDLKEAFRAWLKSQRSARGEELTSRAVSDCVSRVNRIAKALSAHKPLPKGLKSTSIVDAVRDPESFAVLAGPALPQLAGTNDGNALSSLRSALGKFRDFMAENS